MPSTGPCATASQRRDQLLDRLWVGVTRLSGVAVLVVLLAILVALTVGALPALRRFGAGFLTHQSWNPVTEEFGAVAATYGTLVTSAIAMLVGVPVSFGIALFITELCPRWLKRPVGIAVELLAAIPSIIYGMWGLFIFAPRWSEHVQPWLTDHVGGLPLVGPLFQGPPMGIGMLTAGLILAVMVIPFIAAVMRDVFETVPARLKESAYALGATTWEVTWKVVVPYTRVGALGGIMLGLGRALGETMAVTFVIGNANAVHASLFMPGNTISSTLANEFTEAVGEIHTSSLIALGLILFVITAIVLAISRWMLRRLSRGEGVRV